MNTNRYNKIHITFCVFVLVLVMACSDDFLAEKRPYGSFGPELVYGDWASVKLRLNYIYQKSQPYAKGYSLTTNNYPPDLWPIGLPDMLSANTEEFIPGSNDNHYGEYVDPAKVWDYSNIHKFFYYGINESPWKKARECTEVIASVNESTTLTDEQKHQVEAQARFFRATRYFRLFKRYGGIPIVRGEQSTLSGDRDTLAIARKSTAETFQFMVDDCLYAGEHLPANWEEEANDWGRITSGAGYALAGIIANYYASPVFNRSDDVTRWEKAYDLNKKALEKLKEGGVGLAYQNDVGTNASNWAKIWCSMTARDNANTSEAVYIEICNNTSDADGNDLYNCWEQSIRPGNANGGGGITVSAEMVDLFPMADGKRPTEIGEYTYDKKLFFINRDPRFYRTFAFPGTEWKFNGSISTDLASKCPYANGNEYQLMNFAWYADVNEASSSLQSGYFTDLLGSSGKTIYIRKKSQDYALGLSPLYVFTNDEGFKRNGQPLLVIRYAEVLLNFAEAACGSNHLDEAWDALIQIRQRVGYTGNCGLDESIRSNRAKMFEAILYERQIELAYEGKRFDDCHRWMLFDGGAGQSEVYNTFALTGWGGNTCTYLGVTPLNEMLRHKLEICFDPSLFLGPKTETTDPFDSLGISRPKALTLNENMTATINYTTVDGEEQMEYDFQNKDVQALAEFYSKYLIRKDVETMTSESELGVLPVWDKKLYLMGLNSSDQENNPGVVQTVGWTSRFGGTGIFDPLSDTPKTSIDDEENILQGVSSTK